MKVLISGGAGFIGSHLVEHMLKQGSQVTVLDNLSTGNMDNLKGLEGEDLKFFKVDIDDYESIHGYFKGIDCVFHIAALADIVPSIRRPMDYHRSNVDGTISMLEASRRHDVKKFVYAASSSCYGIQENLPTDEKARISPEYPYALTKYVGEQYVLSWTDIYKLPAISLRLFNVYGPRSRTSGAYGAVFGVFLAQKLSGKDFTVVGDGTQTRDFVFVTDVVRAFGMAAESDISGEVFNIGSGIT